MTSRERLLHTLKMTIAGKRVGILGLGREGKSTYQLLMALDPSLKIVLMDRQESALRDLAHSSSHTLFHGDHYLDGVEMVDLVIKTPGISPWLPRLKQAIANGLVITSQTDLFFETFQSQIVAVTGTKGKSTTSSVITQVLTSCGKDALLVGNIGTPMFDALDMIDDATTIVAEISSHQAEGLHHSPHIAVWLNLFQDHLDYYPSMREYIASKKNLFAYQHASDLCLYHCADTVVRAQVENLSSRKIGFALDPMKDANLTIQDGWIVRTSPHVKIIRVEDIPLLGKHNLLNVMPAILVALQLGIDVSAIARALKSIHPVEKRLETVATANGIDFIDDALATIPEATIAAIQALGDKVETLIAGGFDRGQSFEELCQVIATSGIKTLVLFPTTGAKIARALPHGSQIRVINVSTMEDAVMMAYHATSKGKAVLLSTASPSFGLFRDYVDRSHAYLEAIHTLI